MSQQLELAEAVLQQLAELCPDPSDGYRVIRVCSDINSWYYVPYTNGSTDLAILQYMDNQFYSLCVVRCIMDPERPMLLVKSGDLLPSSPYWVSRASGLGKPDWIWVGQARDSIGEWQMRPAYHFDLACPEALQQAANRVGLVLQRSVGELRLRRSKYR